MPIYRLTEEIAFPPPSDAEDGLLAVGGDLSVARLLLAYRSGIFPWYSRGEPILWWSPDPRCVLYPEWFHCSRRLGRVLRSGVFRVSMDTAFERVILSCARIRRRHERGTWIVPAMQRAYLNLHEAGFAHSVECWRGDALVGGLYGVCIGGVFFGESMFARESDASKVALATLVRHCGLWGIGLIDSQVANSHMLGLGAREVARDAYLAALGPLLERPTRGGRWTVVSEAGLG